MNSIDSILKQAVQGMQVQSKRVSVAAENLSNTDTPGYQRKILLAPEITSGDDFKAMRVALDETEGTREYSPSHPLADDEGYITQSNVSLVTEMADMREANRSYEANLNAFQNARTMYSSLLDILRR